MIFLKRCFLILSEILLIAPQIALFKFKILIVGLFQNLFFVCKFQQMISLMILIITGIYKILFTLWFAEIAVYRQSGNYGLAKSKLF